MDFVNIIIYIIGHFVRKIKVRMPGRDVMILKIVSGCKMSFFVDGSFDSKTGKMDIIIS